MPGFNKHIRACSSGLVFLLLLAGAFPAAAQSTKERLTMLEQQFARLERIVSNNDSATDMLRQIQQLQAENQQLRNALETLQFETTQAGDRQRQLYIDLDQRLQALESGGAVAAADGEGAAAAGVAAGGGSERGDYQAAFDLLKEGRYPEAATGFTAFLASYPNSELRDNAQYWLAETHYVRQDFATAVSAFQEVIASYPASRKIPDAWLKIGYCNYELKRWPEARQALSIVEARFPETTAAKLAGQRLTLMNSEGH
jgi:tol-pal system protein YbgF